MALRSLRKEFSVAVCAGESGIRVNTDEIDDAVKTIMEVCATNGWPVYVWDKAVGRVEVGQIEPKAAKGSKAKDGKAPPPPAGKSPASILAQIGGGMEDDQFKQPPDTLLELTKFWKERARPDEAAEGEVQPVVLVLKNFHLAFTQNRHDVSAVIQHILADKIEDHDDYERLRTEIYQHHKLEGDNDTGKFLVGVMPPGAALPDELSPLFKVIDHELPDEAELEVILNAVWPNESDDEDEPDETSDTRKLICKYALGLTRLQAEGVFAAAMVRSSGNTVDPAYVWTEKSRILNKEGLVELYQGKEKFENVAGLTGAKDLLMKLLAPNHFDDADPDCRAKGALFCGPPGVGKSLIAKAAGNELGLPTLMVHPGNWMGQYVGESEAKTRKGFQILKAHAPCLAVVDEVEKVMPKSKGAQGDGGVGARMEGTFLTSMNDMQERVFWVFTANDVKGMHEAFFRAERTDLVFYVGLPGDVQRPSIWKLYLKKFFPAEVTIDKQVVKYPHHIPLDVDALISDVKKAGKKADVAVWGNRLTAAMMTLPPAERETALAALVDANPAVSEAVEPIDDKGWTPAEIRACCRLSRRLAEPLKTTAKKIRPVSVSAASALQSLLKWAAESAIDAETGQLFEMPGEAEEAELTPKAKRTRVVNPSRPRTRSTRQLSGEDGDE